ncbi:MAG: hypothetical protein HKP55_04300 [Gammaproteobacteria bacterium]|nr:hypothetical protein [Gammaproteobacteria bacterium]
MNLQTRLANITPNQFDVFGYCPQCGNHNLVNIKDYSRFTLNEMSYKARCLKCESLGIDVSVVERISSDER